MSKQYRNTNDPVRYVHKRLPSYIKKPNTRTRHNPTHHPHGYNNRSYPLPQAYNNHYPQSFPDLPPNYPVH